ncbi:hypothetical protein J4419_01985 [Candidatus Woesearchaeota archaeon]|nr:hypothetical protein [Candidatus Woesearchaeota archaeon]
MKWVFLFVFLIPFAQAFSCDQVGNRQFCEDVMQSGLNASEKNLLVSQAVSDRYEYPDHEIVKAWNTGLKFSQPPEGVSTLSSGSIRNAWLKIVSIIPSVMDSELLSPGKGEVLSALNYTISLPSGTASGDCKTTYQQTAVSNPVKVSLNDNPIGNSKLTSFETDKDMNFEVQIDIISDYSVSHYQWLTACCQKKRGVCTKKCTTCELHHTSQVQDRLTLADSTQAKYYAPLLKAEFKPIQQYSDTNEARLTLQNQTAFYVDYGDALFEKHFYFYRMNWTFPPYNVLQLQAVPSEYGKIENVNVAEVTNKSYRLTTKNNANCVLVTFSHFSSFADDCAKTFPVSNITIRTDKLDYVDNETIHVILQPNNTRLVVTYGTTSISALGNATFIAQFPYNRITAQMNGFTTEKLISIRKKETLAFFLNLSVFGGVLYSLHFAAKKFIGGPL